MYGLEWLIVWALVGVAAGAGAGAAAGLALAGRRSRATVGRTRELEAQLETARVELTQYRQEAVEQFTETARKFQTLNEAYTDLHQQLARSSSILCGDISGPLLEAPRGHQDVLDRQAPRAGAAPTERAPTERALPPEAPPAGSTATEIDRGGPPPDPAEPADPPETTAAPEAPPPDPSVPDSERSPTPRSADGAPREG